MLFWILLILITGIVFALVPLTHSVLLETGTTTLPLSHVVYYGIAIITGLLGGWFAAVIGSVTYITHMLGCDLGGVCGEGFSGWILISGVIGAVLSAIGLFHIVRRILTNQ